MIIGPARVAAINAGEAIAKAPACASLCKVGFFAK
jgi:hypothetical protein